MGETIAFGATTGYLATPEVGAGPAVIVIPEHGDADGRDLCDRFAEEGFTALVPELQNGQTGEDLVAAIEVLKPHPSVRGHGVGVVGYALGAELALWLATRHPADVVACAVVDGEAPDPPPELCVEFINANPEDDDRLVWIRTLEFFRKHLG